MKTAKQTDQKIFAFFQTPRGGVVFGLLMWLVAYLLVSLAIDSGSILEWLCAIVAFFWGLTHLVRALVLFVRNKVILRG